jgi:hypothetical protein
MKMFFMSENGNQINDIVEKNAKTNEEGNTNNNGENSNENNSNENNSGSENGENQNSNQQAAPEQEDKLANLLKELGAESLDELKEKLAKAGEKKLTPEEEEKAQAIYEANLQKYAVENGKMKLEDFQQLNTLKSKQDADLLFEGHKKDFIEENAKKLKEENEDLTDADIEALAKEDFEKEYKLNSASEKQKQKGIQRLAKDAAELRNPLQSSYDSVKEEFDTETDVRNNFPKFVETVNSLVKEVIPEKINYFTGKDGETSIPIEVELTADEIKDISEKVNKRIQNPDTYNLFKSGKKAELKTLVTEYTEFLTEKAVQEKGKSKIAEIFLGIGTKKGSTVGAENSFAVNQSKGAAHNNKQSSTDKEKTVLDQFGKK